MTVEEHELKFICNVKTMRRRQNMTVEEMAEKSGLPLEMLEQLERDILPEEMVVEDAVKLAGVFRCKIHELFE